MNYLKIYKQLVQKRKKLPAELFFDYTQNHHIIPRSYKPELSDNCNNIVNLSARQHFIAHALLVKIAKQQNNKPLYYKMLCAFDAMSKLYGSIQHPQYRYKNSHLYALWKIELIKYIKESGCKRGQNSSSYNKIAIYNPQTQELRRINKNQQIPEGWLRGEPQRMKRKGQNGNTYGTKWIYNQQTLEQKLLKKGQQLEQGWIYGISPISKAKTIIHPNPTKGKMWITNIQTFEYKLIDKDDQIPNGWIKGKISNFENYKIKKQREQKKIKRQIKQKQVKEVNREQKLQKAKQYFEVYKVSGYKGIVQKYNYKYSRVALCNMFNRYLKEEYKLIKNLKIIKSFVTFIINNVILVIERLSCSSIGRVGGC